MKINIWNFDEIEKTTRRQLEALRAENKNGNLGLQCRCVIILSTINSLKSIYFGNREELYAGKEASVAYRRHFPGAVFLEAAKSGIITPRQVYEATVSDPDKVSVLVQLAKLINDDEQLLEKIFEGALETWEPPEDRYNRPARLEIILKGLYYEGQNYPNWLHQKILDKISTNMEKQVTTLEELKFIAKYADGKLKEIAIDQIRQKATSSRPTGVRTPFKLWIRGYGWSAYKIYSRAEKSKRIADERTYVEAICALFELSDDKQKALIISEVNWIAPHIKEPRYRLNLLSNIHDLPDSLFQEAILEFLFRPATVHEDSALELIEPHLDRLRSQQRDYILNRLVAIKEHLAANFPDNMYVSKLILSLAPDLNYEQMMLAKSLVNSKHEFQYLIKIAPKLSLNEIEELFARAISLEQNFFKSKAVVDLAPHLSREQINQSIDILEASKDEGDKYTLIAGLVEFLEEDQLDRVIKIAENLTDTVYDDFYGYYSMIFALLAKHAPETKKHHLFKRAIDNTFIYNLDQRYNLFRPLITDANKENLDRMLFQLSRLSDCSCDRSQMLNLLVPRLDQRQLITAMNIVNSCEDGASLSYLLSELAQYMSGPEKDALLHDAVMFSIHEEFGEYREYAIADLTPYLDEKQSAYAIKLCKKYTYRDNRTRILSNLNENLSVDLDKKIEDTIRNISSFPNRINYLASICHDTYPNIPPIIFKYISENLDGFGQHSHHPDPFLRIAPYLKPDLSEMILDIILPKALEFNYPFGSISKLAPLMNQEQAAFALKGIQEKVGQEKEETIDLLKIMMEPYSNRQDIVIQGVQEYKQENLLSAKLYKEGYEKNKVEIRKIYHRNESRDNLFTILNIEDAIYVAKEFRFLGGIFEVFRSSKDRKLIAKAILEIFETQDTENYPYHTLLQLVPYMDTSQKQEAIPIAMTSPDNNKRIELLTALGVAQPENHNAVSDEDFEKQFHSDKALVPISYRISKLKPLLQQYNGDKKLEVVSDLIEDLSKTTRGAAVGTISALVPTIFEQEGTEGINEILSVIREIVELPNYDEYLDL